MRYLSLIVPEKIYTENVGTDSGEEHIKLTSHDDGPEISFLRKGDSASQGLPLSVLPKTGIPGGVFNRSKSRRLMTRKIFLPYKLAVSFEEEPTNEDFYGVTELGVRKFMRSTFSDPMTTDTRGSKHRNSRIFSFEGDLFYLCEQRVSFGSNFATVPKIFKYDKSLDEFQFYHVFDDPVSIYRSASNDTQFGSPDYFVFKGMLHVGYRVINKDARRNEILIWRQTKQGQWIKLSTLPILNSFDNLEVKSLKIRIATSSDAIMVVYYSIDQFNRGAQPRERHDMRSYVSYDGVNFTSKSKSFDTISLDGNGNFLNGLNVSNMAYHFIPRQEYTGDNSVLVGSNVNFALYYDTTLASFVILKSGDPAGKIDPLTGVADLNGNDTWLMGIKTVDGDYSTWENCVNFELSPSNTGILPDESGIVFGSPDTNSELDSMTYRLRIIDIDVVPGIETNVMAITWREFNGHDSRSGTCLNEFEFVSADQIEAGSDDYHYEVGSKSHPEWSFLTRRFDPDACGLFGGGTYSVPPVTAYVNSISICRWREQIVVTSFSNFRVVFTMFSQWQNVSENSGYQVAYSGIFGPVTRFSYVDQVGGTYNSVNSTYLFTAASGAIFLANSGSPITPDLLSLNHPTKLSRLATKVRFVVSVVDGSNAEVLTVRLKSILENVDVTISLEIGEIFVFTDIGSGDVLHTEWAVPVTDWSLPYEFIFGNSGASIYLYYRLVGTDKFFLAGKTTVVPTGASLGPFGHVLVGALGGTSDVVFYDLQIGTYNKAHRATFADSLNFSTSELGNRSLSGPNCPTVKCAELPFELMDGSLVSLRGIPQMSSADLEIYKYEFVSSETSNTPVSLVDGLSDRLFDVTKSHSILDHCHCYKSAPPLDSNDTDYGYQFLFRKEPRIFDAFSLINAFGFHCFNLILGEHDGTSWTSVTGQVKYKLTRKELTTYEVQGASFSVSDIFDQGQIIGYCVMKYSTISETYEDTFQVKRNFQRVIILDRDIGVFEEHHVMHLFFTSASYQLPEELFEISQQATHVGLRIFGVPSTNLIGLGEFIVGQSFDLSEFTNQMSATMEGDVTVTDGEYGLIFNKGATYRPAVESFSIDTSVRFGGMTLTNMLRQVQRDELLMALVEQRSNGSNWTWPVVKGNVSYGSMDYLQEINVNLIAQNYFARKTRKERYSPPVLELTYSPEFVLNVISTISATATDPSGGTLTYDWFVSSVKVPETTSDLDLTVTEHKSVEVIRCTVTSSISGLSETKFAYLFRRDIPQVESVELVDLLDPIVIGDPTTTLVTISIVLSSGFDFGSNYARGSLSFYKDSGEIDPVTGEPIYLNDYFINLAFSFTNTASVIWAGYRAEVELRFFGTTIDVDFELTSDPMVSTVVMVYEDEFGFREVRLLNVTV